MLKKSERRKMFHDVTKWATNDGTQIVVSLLLDAHERLDELTDKIDEVRTFLAQHTSQAPGTAHYSIHAIRGTPSFQFDENKFFEVPKPSQAELVYDTIKKHQDEKVMALAPIFAELLPDSPSNWELIGLEKAINDNWEKDEDEFKEICIRRADLEFATGLHHQTLKRCTDHLKYRGYIRQVGHVGGTDKVVRFGVPTDQIYGLTTWFFEYADERWPDRPGYD